MKRTRLWLLAAMLLTAALPNLAQAANYDVTQTSDDGTGNTINSLSWAINQANGNAGDDTITLQVNVTLSGALPQITSTMTIEGTGNTIDANGGNFSVLYVTSNGNLTLNEATVTGANKTSGDGGGIYNYSGTVTLNNSTVSNNTTSGFDSSGGGIFNNGTVILTNSTVSSNTASSSFSTSFGGGIFNNGGTVTLTNSTVSSNTASSSFSTSFGGGIFNSYGIVTLTNSTVSSNTASSSSSDSFGGGIYNVGTVTLRSSIISGNTAINGGNEVYNDYPGIFNAASFNVFGHSSETSAQAFVGFTPSGSDVNAASDGGAPTALSSILLPLADNGGATKTHALPAGSPAIDIDTTCGTGLATDQRGYTRQINFKCDAGAVEYSPSFSLASGNGRDLPASTWLMTAPPCQPADPPGTSINAQYGDDISGGSYGSNWIAYAWDAAATPQIYVLNGADDPLTLGNGNWLYSTIPATLTLTGTATTTAPCSNYGSGLTGSCFAISLMPFTGTALWQMVGHPFPYSVSWADVRVATCSIGCDTPAAGWTQRTPSQAAADNIMAKEQWRWSGSAYESKDDATVGMIGTLLPQEAVWVRMLPDSAAFSPPGNIKLLIPAQ